MWEETGATVDAGIDMNHRSGSSKRDISVRATDQNGIQTRGPTIEVFDEDGLVVTITAFLGREIGADGGMYPVIKFRQTWTR